MPRLERRVEKFLDFARKTMDLVDKKNRVRLESGKYRRKVSRAFYGNPGGAFELGSERRGDKMGKGRFPDSRRAVEEDVFGHPAALFSGIDGDAYIRFYLFLADIVIPMRRPERSIERLGKGLGLSRRG
jgi:hypothetical protein